MKCFYLFYSIGIHQTLPTSAPFGATRKAVFESVCLSCSRSDLQFLEYKWTLNILTNRSLSEANFSFKGQQKKKRSFDRTSIYNNSTRNLLSRNKEKVDYYPFFKEGEKNAFSTSYLHPFGFSQDASRIVPFRPPTTQATTTIDFSESARRICFDKETRRWFLSLHISPFSSAFIEGRKNSLYVSFCRKLVLEAEGLFKGRIKFSPEKMALNLRRILSHYSSPESENNSELLELHNNYYDDDDKNVEAEERFPADWNDHLLLLLLLQETTASSTFVDLLVKRIILDLKAEPFWKIDDDKLPLSGKGISDRLLEVAPSRTSRE